VQEICGISAKQYLIQKIVLQAKRLLVHTDQAIGVIGLELGFNEPTNFVKFFKCEAGMSPLTFRQMYL
jgi:AraC-like DNA-binding protein